MVLKLDTYVLVVNRMEMARDFVTMAERVVGFCLVWEGKEDNEIGIDRADGKTLAGVNPQLYRPTVVGLLIGSLKKAKHEPGWETKTTLEQLCQIMVAADIRRNEVGFSF